MYFVEFFDGTVSSEVQAEQGPQGTGEPLSEVRDPEGEKGPECDPRQQEYLILVELPCPITLQNERVRQPDISMGSENRSGERGGL